MPGGGARRRWNRRMHKYYFNLYEFLKRRIQELKGKLENRCFCWYLAAVLVSLKGTPTWGSGKARNRNPEKEREQKQEPEPGIGTVIKRGTYIKTGTTFIIIYVNLDLILIHIYTKNKGKKGIETVYRNMRRKGYNH